MRRGASIARRLLHAGHVGRDLAGADGSLLNIAGDLLRGRALLFDRRSNCRSDLVELSSASLWLRRFEGIRTSIGEDLARRRKGAKYQRSCHPVLRA